MSTRVRARTQRSAVLRARRYDASFDAQGYTLVAINNLAGAYSAVCLKQKLDAKVCSKCSILLKIIFNNYLQELGTFGLLYYNALFVLPISILILAFTNDLDAVSI